MMMRIHKRDWAGVGQRVRKKWESLEKAQHHMFSSHCTWLFSTHWVLTSISGALLNNGVLFGSASLIFLTNSLLLTAVIQQFCSAYVIRFDPPANLGPRVNIRGVPLPSSAPCCTSPLLIWLITLSIGGEGKIATVVPWFFAPVSKSRMNTACPKGTLNKLVCKLHSYSFYTLPLSYRKNKSLKPWFWLKWL